MFPGDWCEIHSYLPKASLLTQQLVWDVTTDEVVLIGQVSILGQYDFFSKPCVSSLAPSTDPGEFSIIKHPKLPGLATGFHRAMQQIVGFTTEYAKDRLRKQMNNLSGGL